MHETYDRDFPNDKATRLSPRLGIIGGGQLARMTALAAAPLGVEVVVLERNPGSPATGIVPHTLVGDWDSKEVLREFAGLVDCATLENEFVSPDSLAYLESLGCPVRPGSRCLRLIQDKFAQKQTLVTAGLAVPPFAEVDTQEALVAFAEKHGWPVVLKARRNAYDGKGNQTVKSAAGVPQAWAALRGGPGVTYAEAFCRFTKELAVMVTRSVSGECAVYPVVETVQENHVCSTVVSPADIDAATARLAADTARRAVEAVGAVGSFGVELFLTSDGAILVNELAPRVHNSGHYTIEACLCSQFENHVRAALGLPLGSTEQRSPAAAMVNLLGHSHEPALVHGLHEALAVPDAHVHLYGKLMSGLRRKLGHVTALGSTREEALDRARRAAACLRFGHPS